MARVASWVAHAIDGAKTSLHDAMIMATAVEVLGADLRKPRKAANKARAVARDSPVKAARRVSAARRGTSVLHVNETQEEASTAEEADEGKAPPTQERNCANKQSWACGMHRARVVRKGVARRNNGGSS